MAKLCTLCNEGENTTKRHNQSIEIGQNKTIREFKYRKKSPRHDCKASSMARSAKHHISKARDNAWVAVKKLENSFEMIFKSLD